MTTKNNPGQFDCYAKAAPDEPMFVLLARDPLAPDLLREWVKRSCLTCSDEKAYSALSCADAMEEWRRANPPKSRSTEP